MILKSSKDEGILLYNKAGNASDLFAVWSATYKKSILGDLIFIENSSPYEIGVKPLRKKDLVPLSQDNKIINEFEEILRHNNVSDKENAFNRLVALFICKLVDEVTKEENAVLDFQWQSGKDDYEKLQDRLQRLHRDGMKNFMGEEIFYVENEYPDLLFSNYTGAKRQQAINDLKSTIRKLKFYSNNDFAFKDVHNEELFLQNGKIVVEVVLLFQKYRIIYNETNQLLGDLFEKLLSKGFKQNEGQFFTPLPITRFIWDSLPLKTIMKGGKLPTVIDYSCGAGHFLIEAIEAINHYRKSKKTDWARNSIFGVEKDYRLARVAKISLFMHGAGDANIIFGDGLETNAEKQILDNKFSILVANPPYSVQGFKSHLKIKNKDSFLILDKISNEGSEIECLFVERTAQLLAPNGVAAIILPSSILSNNSNSYVAARENILNNFMIKAIVSLGSGTFSETGTNTVILFLQKYNEPPKMSDLAKDCLSFIFDSLGKLSLLKDWKEKEIYTSFLSLIGVSEDVYGYFLKEEYSYDDLMQGEEVSLNYFKQYAALIFSSSTIKNMEGKKFFAEMDVEAQKKEKMKYFYREVKEKEREKLLYFSLLFGHKTLLVRLPESNDAQKEFLGYGWSKRKGDEGIKIIKLGGTLYAGDDREAEGTIAFLIRNAFEGSFEIDEKMKTYAQVVMSTSLLDFSNSSFTKSIKTVIKEKTEIKSKWKMVRLGEVATTIETGSRPQGGVGNIKSGVYSIGGEHIDKSTGYVNLSNPKYVTISFFNESKSGRVKKDDILLCKDGALTGKIAIVRNEFDNLDAMINEHVFLLRAPNLTTQKYMFIFLHSNAGQNILKENITGSAQGGLNSTNLKNIRIPLPPLDIQQKLVAECKEVDKEYESSRMSVEEYKRKIEILFKELEIIEKTGGGIINLVKFVRIYLRVVIYLLITGKKKNLKNIIDLFIQMELKKKLYMDIPI